MIPEEVGKGLDATTEVAKTVGKGIDGLNGLGSFFARLFGPSMTEAGAYLGDTIAFWRQMRGLEFAKKFQNRCEQLGFDLDTIRPIPLSLKYRIVEAASLEDTDEIQELWAELLAKSLNPDTNFVASKLHISLIREIGPAEAVLLEALKRIEPLLVEVRSDYLNLETALEARNQEIEAILNQKWRDFSLSDRDLAVKNLTRLDCIVWAPPHMPNLDNMFNETEVDLDTGRRGYLKITEVNHGQFEDFVNWIYQSIEASSGAQALDVPAKARFHDVFGRTVATMDAPETGLKLTSLGRNLLAAVTP
jgi:hypothetical protein